MPQITQLGRVMVPVVSILDCSLRPTGVVGDKEV
jgi:hypothetical protein